MTGTTATPSTTQVPVHRVIPYAHVADVQESLDFYALLGFVPGNTQRNHAGKIVWAWAQSEHPKAGLTPAPIMFAQASGPVNPAEQAVLFYMHCRNVGALRAHLIASGVADGSDFRPRESSEPQRSVAYAVTHPPYMPEGEMRVHDPDGYVILVGQSV